jgi:hypothetical protein
MGIGHEPATTLSSFKNKDMVGTKSLVPFSLAREHSEDFLDG